MHLVQIKKKTF